MATPSAPTTYRPVVLVVDDEPMQCTMVRRLLECDYEVLTAHNVSGAMEIASYRVIDVALVDYRMPGELGTIFLAHLKRTQPSCVRFLCTAYAESEVVVEAVNVGHIYGFVQKPIDAPALRLDIQRAIEHAHADHEVQRVARLEAAGRVASLVVRDIRDYLNQSAHEGASDPTVRRARERLSALSDEIASLTDAEPREYAREIMRLEDVVRDAVADLSKTDRLSGRDVDIEVEKDLPAVKVSAAHIYRVLMHLLDNAAKATPDTKRMGVRLKRGKGFVICEVWDNGEGIHPNLQNRLFEPLVTESQANTGLGLWSCQLAMRSHGGNLSFSTTPGVGSSFIATFPIVDA